MSTTGIDAELTRWLAVAGVLLAYAALCAAVGVRHLRRARAARDEAASLGHAAPGGASWLVAYASQTGTAERIAHHTAQALHAAGQAVQLMTLREVQPVRLASTTHALLVVSTYGEGDPPDNAAGFLEALPGAGLQSLRYGVLALGDHDYRHFCGYGRTVDQALADSGAVRLFDRMEVDQGDEAAIGAWVHALGVQASASDLADWREAPWQRWTLASRRLLNAGSVGAPVWLLRLHPPEGEIPAWESGDLVQILPPPNESRPREYSIASLPADGALELIVRLGTRSDGTPGLVSGWLGGTAVTGDAVPLRLRQHHAFRLGDNASRPLLLIGNGTGLAGLRAHLRAQAATGRGRNWLVFGERNAAHDSLLADEILAWREAGVLERVDLVFSRDQPERRHVQDLLDSVAPAVVDWVQAGAAIYVCGSLQGMAAGVDQVLRATLGSDLLDALAASGRYRRDVY